MFDFLDRRRSEEEIKDMDQKNKIKSELVGFKAASSPSACSHNAFQVQMLYTLCWSRCKGMQKPLPTPEQLFPHPKHFIP